MVDRVSALDGLYRPGRYGDSARAGVILENIPDLVLHQVAAWPDSMDAVGKALAKQVGARADAAAGPGASTTGDSGAMLRIEPMKWWLVGIAAPEFDAGQAVTLDLSHRLVPSGVRLALALMGVDHVLLLRPCPEVGDGRSAAG